MQCAQCNVNCAQCIVFTAHCALCTLPTVHCTHCTMHSACIVRTACFLPWVQHSCSSRTTDCVLHTAAKSRRSMWNILESSESCLSRKMTAFHWIFKDSDCCSALDTSSSVSLTVSSQAYVFAIIMRWRLDDTVSLSCDEYVNHFLFLSGYPSRLLRAKYFLLGVIISSSDLPQCMTVLPCASLSLKRAALLSFSSG